MCRRRNACVFGKKKRRKLDEKEIGFVMFTAMCDVFRFHCFCGGHGIYPAS